MAWAELPPPDYRDALLASVESEADLRISEGDLDGAEDLVVRFRDRVEDDARLVYELGLIARLRGDADAAEKHLRAALAMDGGLGFAWYDLGELLLLEDDLSGAEDAFTHAADLTADHTNGWAGPFRLAELAARRGDPAAFDRHLKTAVSRGFRFQTVVGDPAWTSFLADPELGEVLRRLIVVYGEEHILDGWSVPKTP
ncbi:MAG: hypothetical protein GY913_25705 [Proteobacteria bacterium]|nr:hypothetical protein [Pseudomonadota bacterium]MCP4920311.1 hypothetical protein [Pseudomonadota bacterium]